MELVKILIDRTSKINNRWMGFHNDIHMFTILRKNLYPEHVVDVLLHRCVTSRDQQEKELSKHYFKIPYIRYFSVVAQHRVRKLINRFCKPIDIKLVYSTLKVKVPMTELFLFSWSNLLWMLIWMAKNKIRNLFLIPLAFAVQTRKKLIFRLVQNHARREQLRGPGAIPDVTSKSKSVREPKQESKESTERNLPRKITVELTANQKNR